MVYLARKNGVVVHHTNRDAMREMDGIEAAEMEVSDEEFETAGSLARIIDGEIFLGKTEAEKKREEAESEIRVLKAKLLDTDYIAAKIAEGSATAEDYAEKIAERQEWRAKINELEEFLTA